MVATAVFVPSRGGGERPRGAAGEARPAPAWRVDLRSAQGIEIATVMVDDHNGAARRLPDPLAGDRAAQWIRWIHEGSHSGPVWQAVVFLCGIFPTMLAITGLVIWLRGRARRKAGAQARLAPQLGAAE